MNVTVSEGASFAISNEIGDILAEKEAGLYDEDTRFLSRYEIFINNTKPTVLTGRQVDYYSAVFYLTNAATDTIAGNLIGIARKRFVGNGLHEDIDITSYSREPLHFKLRFEFDTDFADIFEVKAGIAAPTEITPDFLVDKENGSLVFKYQSDDFYRETRIVFGESLEFDIDTKAVTFNIKLEPGQHWHTCIDFLTLTSPEPMKPKYGCESFEMTKSYTPIYSEDWIRSVPKLFTDYDTLQHAYELSVLDMAALRLRGARYTEMGVVPAAGIPWFVACFGRDSLITSYQTMPYLPDVSYGSLRKLAKYQGQEVNPLNEEEPGKILHEIRWGRITAAGKTPYKLYYGTIDTTPLFIITLSELYRWTADREFVEELKEPFFKALDWIDRYGDKDNDGYVEYKKMGREGLDNQGWKDSWDSIRFADGRFAEAPIALCEVQGYVYMAKLRSAELMDLLGDNKRAIRLREEAAELKQRFNRDFWMEDAGYFALALDKDKNKVDAIASNPGQLLWTGIVDDEKADIIKQRLFSPDMFSGWGIRTMSSLMAAYNPLSYHVGSVWPHDNMIIASGLMNYGFYEEGLRIVDSLLDAGQYFNYQRLPELFCGFDRKSSMVPIEYPAASSPQAWASGSSMLMLSAVLGMKAEADQKLLILNPHLPIDIYRIHLAGVRIGESFISFEILKERGEIVINITENPASYKIKLERGRERFESRYRKTGTEG